MSAEQSTADVVAVVRDRVRRGEDAVIFATRGQIKDARGWAADCLWADATGDEIMDMPAVAVVRGVDRHYDRGWAQFVADGSVEA